jgi:predicted transposase/invertase (TIGR01784 family)
MQKGIQKGKLELIHTMKSNGMDMNLIVKYSGLSESEIKDIIN